MIYRSNLACPDLQPAFVHTECRPMPHSLGHDVLSDWADKSKDDPAFGLYKRCGLWTHDEIAILFHCVQQVGGRWIDIGSHTGWTTAHIVAAGAHEVTAIDTLYPPSCPHDEYVTRFWENLTRARMQQPVKVFGGTSGQFFQQWEGTPIDGAVIDGAHDSPIPLQDAQGAAQLLTPHGIILFHDYIGKPVRDAADWLVSQGFQRQVYLTPHIVCVCWRQDFDPPEHQPDPSINWSHVKRSLV